MMMQHSHRAQLLGVSLRLRAASIAYGTPRVTKALHALRALCICFVSFGDFRPAQHHASAYARAR